MVELKLAVEQLMAEVKMLRNMQTNTRNSHQTFRNTGALLTTSYATVFIFLKKFPLRIFRRRSSNGCKKA